MIPYCYATGVGIIPWSPIARGVLARPRSAEKSHREQNDAWIVGLGFRKKERSADDDIIDRVEEVAKKKGVGMAMVATAWCLSKQNVNPIVGLSSVERIDQAVEAVKRAEDGLLTKEDMAYLEEPYVPKPIMATQ